jgi:hypothetical protein
MLGLINGGAAVAVLTYLGNLASKPAAPCILPDIQWPQIAYGSGVFTVGLAFALAYSTQLVLYGESTRQIAEG